MSPGGQSNLLMCWHLGSSQGGKGVPLQLQAQSSTGWSWREAGRHTQSTLLCGCMRWGACMPTHVHTHSLV